MRVEQNRLVSQRGLEILVLVLKMNRKKNASNKSLFLEEKDPTRTVHHHHHDRSVLRLISDAAFPIAKTPE